MSQHRVVELALKECGGSSTAKKLCDTLMDEFHFSRKDAQLTIQRATDDGIIKVNSDWTISSS